jgi:c-di-GMP-binding flagellar brake protein YcgR
MVLRRVLPSLLPLRSMKDMSNTKNEHRRHTRYDFPSTIEYVLEPPTNDAVVHKGVTVNISSTGLGLYMFELLPEGQEIIIKTGLPVDRQAAKVRWIKQQNSSFYFTGLKFI